MENGKMDFRPFMERLFFGMLFGGCAVLWSEIGSFRSSIAEHDKSLSSLTTKLIDLEKRLDRLEN